MAIKKIQYNAEKETAEVVDATVLDVVTTAVSTTEVLPGFAGLMQRGALFLGGMSVQNYLNRGSFVPSFRRA